MKFLCILSFILLLLGCQQKRTSQPRPHQYPRINYPEKKVVSHQEESCPFIINIPAHSRIEKKELFFDEVPANPCWFDILMPHFNATVHCSYYPIGSKHSLDKLVNDAYTMASKHNVKASFREEFVVKNKHGASGLIFKINGDVATPYQFYITDSINHFLRGSLYFNEKTNADSIRPILAYIEQDIDDCINSIKWN